jgi:pimeloyl-ACP methyl ester carboxylesterase
VRRSPAKIAAILLTAGAFASTSVASALAGISYAPCGDTNDYACGHLTVRLDPSGAVPGAITLAMRRHRAPVGDAREAVIALAGGPGQAAIPLAEDFASLLGPIVATRDLIVFDPRGIGLSHRLSCHRFEVPSGAESSARAVAECAAQIGPTRAFFTTAQTVADIEAIRQAGGYEKLVLYGTSFGTKVAERYAQEYPSRVGGLVLDSVVPPNGPDPLNRPTLQAIPRILNQLCALRSCARITTNPVGDLGRVVARAGRGRLHGRWIDGHGRSHRIGISSQDLLGALIEGDLEPILRSEFPAAARSAARGDKAALARLLHRAESLEEKPRESPSESFDGPLYYTTICEEVAFPWSRGASPQTRRREARESVRALPSRSIAPFGPADALALSDMPACSAWPFASPPPPVGEGPLPRVPALILSGADDLRTPTASAREVAAQIPGSHLLVVPHVGHSVLGSDLSGCAHAGLEALFASQAIKPCRDSLPPIGLAPLPPARLAEVPVARGNHGVPGRTLRAVSLTLGDFGRQITLQAIGDLGSGNLGALGSLRVGGLRAGWAAMNGQAGRFHHFSYVPGVTISGRLTGSSLELRVGGYAAAHGTLGGAPHGRLQGVLGGQRVQLATGGGPQAVGSLGARVRLIASESRTRAPRRAPAAERPRPDIG